MNLWDNNLSLLSKKNPKLSEKLTKHSLQGLEILHSKDGSITAKYNGFLLNSLYNPKEEAQIRISNLQKLQISNLLICMGTGLGYELNELFDQTRDECFVLIVVTNMDILAGAMMNMDLSKALSRDRLFIIDGTGEDIKSELRDVDISLLYHFVDVETYIHPVHGKLDKDTIENVLTQIKEILLTRTFSLGNSAADSLLGLKHTLLNYEFIMKTPNLLKYKGYFKNIPAICVASGPSLEKNIQYLKQIQGKAVIFAAESVMDRLKMEGIKFQFVSVIERGEPSYTYHFMDKPLGEDVIVLGNAVVFPKIVSEHNGKSIIVFRNTTRVENSFSLAMSGLNGIDIGLSTANQNFAVADYLGFSPIILIGQDLAYGNGEVDHAEGVSTIGPVSSLHILGEEIYLKGYYGGIVRSTKVWKLFLQFFENYIEANKVLCINATEGGANIEGAVNMTFKEAIEKYCYKSLGINLSSIFEYPKEEERIERQKLFKSEIDNQLKDVDTILDLCINLNFALDNFIREYRIGNNKYKELKELIGIALYEMLRHGMATFVVQALISNAIRRNKLVIDSSNETEVEAWYNTNKGFFQEVKDIMGIMKDLYRETFETGKV